MISPDEEYIAVNQSWSNDASYVYIYKKQQYMAYVPLKRNTELLWDAYFATDEGRETQEHENAGTSRKFRNMYVPRWLNNKEILVELKELEFSYNVETELIRQCPKKREEK